MTMASTTAEDVHPDGNFASPVAVYGKSSEFGQILDFIQFIISKDALRREFDIPHLVVIGRQNMAKTTLINRLIGRYLLPMRRADTDGATRLQALTTCPIILNLRHGDCNQVVVTCDSQPDLGINKSLENPEDDDVEKFLKEAADMLPKEDGTMISMVPLNVSFQGPDLITLTLVDLPGVHFANDNGRMNDVTQKLVLDYIKNNTKSIIVIVSEAGDPTGDGAINLVMKQAPDYRERTICVLTKPDKLRETDDLGRKVAMNESSFTLQENRFIFLRGKDGTDPKERDWDAETTRIKEKEWFRSHPMYQDIPELCGVDRLMGNMVSLLAEKMVNEIPVLVDQMRLRRVKVEGELSKLAETEVPENKEGRGAAAMKLRQQLTTQLRTMLFNNTTNILGGEAIRDLFRNFHKKIFAVDPLEGRTDEKLKELQQKLEGVPAPLGQSSENNQFLVQLVNEVFYTEYGVLPSPVDQLLPICKTLVKEVEWKMRKIVGLAIDETWAAYPKLMSSVKSLTIGPIFDKKRAETELYLTQFLAMQKESVDTMAVEVPLPAEINGWICWRDPTGNNGRSSNNGVDRIHPVSNSSLMGHLSYLSTELYPFYLRTKFETTISSDSQKEKEQMKNAKKNVARCFNVIKMQVAEAVPRCIQYFLVRQLVEELEQALTVEDLVEHVQEKKEVRIMRTRYRKELKALNEALGKTDDVTRKLLTMKNATE